MDNSSGQRPARNEKRTRQRAEFSLDPRHRAELRQLADDSGIAESRIVDMGLEAVLPGLRKKFPVSKEVAA